MKTFSVTESQKAEIYEKRDKYKNKITKHIQNHIHHSTMDRINKGLFPLPKKSILSGIDKNKQLIIISNSENSETCEILEKSLSLSEKHQKLINYMVSNCKKFKKLFDKILEFEENCIVLLILTQSQQNSLRLIALNIFGKVLENFDWICSSRQNYDSLLVSILYFTAKKIGIENKVFLTLIGKIEGRKNLKISQIKRWKCFLLISECTKSVL